MAAPWGVLALVVVALAAAPSAQAQGRVSGDMPTVKLEAPRADQSRGAARSVTVRVSTEARDCSARPTVTIVGAWKGRSGPAVLEVSGIERVVSLSPRPAARRTDRITFRRVRVVRGVARVQAVLVTDWRHAEKGRSRCEMRLPRLVGLGSFASDAQRGLNRLRMGVEVEPPKPIPQRVTATEHLWACGGGRRTSFDCGVRVAAGFPRAEEKDDSENDPPDWAFAVLAAAGALGVGGIAAAAVKRPKGGTDVSDSWDETAREEYRKPQEPIGAHASQLTSFGAPIAAFIVAVAAAFGGVVADAPPAETVIGVSVVIAAAVAGVFYVFASDFRTRGTVAVARFNNLSKHAEAEARATNEVQREADRKLAEANATKNAADEAQAAADERMAEADEALEAAHSRETAAARAEQDANSRVAAAEASQADATEKLTAAQEALRRCEEKLRLPPAPPPSPSSSFLTLGGISAIANGENVTVHAIESVNGNIVRYLVVGSDQRLRWVAEGEMGDVG